MKLCKTPVEKEDLVGERECLSGSMVERWLDAGTLASGCRVWTAGPPHAWGHLGEAVGVPAASFPAVNLWNFVTSMNCLLPMNGHVFPRGKHVCRSPFRVSVENDQKKLQQKPGLLSECI